MNIPGLINNAKLNNTPILELDQVRRGYGEERVLEGISFSVMPGEFLAIVGKSGTGKSTLLRIMAGLLDTEAGEVRFQGEPLKGPAARLVPGYEEIQLVHQQFELHDFMSAEENIRRPILGYVREYQEEIVTELLDLSGLLDKRRKKPYELSGGQQQKLALSTALAVEPEVLLMDEPFSNLDPFSKQDFLRAIKRMALEHQVACVFVTHDTRDALAVADRVLVMDQGTIVQAGTPEEVYHSPVTEEIGRFLGPLNLFDQEEWKATFGSTIEPKGMIGVRPEDLFLVNTGEGLAGTVKERVFTGPNTYLFVQVAGKEELIEVAVPGAMLREGAEVFLGVNQERLIDFRGSV